MEYITELHSHSKYAAACSEQLTLENMAQTCDKKGISLIGTADFTHPLWSKEIKEKLEETGPGSGIFKLRGPNSKARFLLTAEVSTVFHRDKSLRGAFSPFDRTGMVKRFHNGILAPSIEVIEQISSQLSKFGDLSSDGRPMLMMRASELVEIVNSISPECLVYAAHAWTPWFGVFGSLSGFDSMEEAYEDQAMHVPALETGLSSDPQMNWRLSKLDKYAIISGSDAHSLPKLGREATVFEIEQDQLSYSAIAGAIRKKQIKYTIEFYPEEGKYHYDGHRKCNVSMSPTEAKKYNYICPVCRRKLTLGVLHRVEELADREDGYTPKGAVPFVHAVPLREIIASVSGKSEASVYVLKAYEKLLEKFGTEMDVLLKSDTESIKEVDKELASAIENVREGRVKVTPGYDGVFGIVDVANKVAAREGSTQKTISDF